VTAVMLATSKASAAATTPNSPPPTPTRCAAQPDALAQMKVLPHVAQNTSKRRSAVPEAVAQTDGYAISQQKRKLIDPAPISVQIKS
jgi:hypothetical protein